MLCLTQQFNLLLCRESQSIHYFLHHFSVKLWVHGSALPGSHCHFLPERHLKAGSYQGISDKGVCSQLSAGTYWRPWCLWSLGTASPCNSSCLGHAGCSCQILSPTQLICSHWESAVISWHGPTEQPQRKAGSLIVRKVWQCPPPPQSKGPCLCLTWHVRGQVDRLHLPTPSVNRTPLLSASLWVSGTPTQTEELQPDKASHIWWWNLLAFLPNAATTAIIGLIQCSGWYLQQRLWSEHAVFSIFCIDGFATPVTLQDKCHIYSWPPCEAHCGFSSAPGCCAPSRYQPAHPHLLIKLDPRRESRPVEAQ